MLIMQKLKTNHLKLIKLTKTIKAKTKNPKTPYKHNRLSNNYTTNCHNIEKLE